MYIIFITLAVIGILLYIISYFVNDRIKELDDQLEQLSLTMMQDSYQMKKKLKVLEEELLTEDLTSEIMKEPYQKQTGADFSMTDKIYSMYKRGFKPHYIAKEMQIEEQEVQKILLQLQKQGAARQ
ncbi:hypothetical protein MUN89_10990 [Halobacillus salinarum]|uniref:Uncharacterized protein n=1 Tax=Halobacillus salinarum TaxID=2932257 RepID=A0ABY4EEH4_9BACI|nr:hypothetical protein [Halobacillus salinarum]UOQ42514.1 hypothetical protein MUN89_10990 [Halobacillus salinarum]